MFKQTTLAERINLAMPNGGVTSQSDLARKMNVNRQTGEMTPEAALTTQQAEVLALWESLPKAAKEHWLTQGRDLSSLLSPNSSNNPFGARRK